MALETSVPAKDSQLLRDSLETPASRLGKQLSPKSIISTPFVKQEQSTLEGVRLETFEFLDNGWCGDVFTYTTGKTPQVLKRAKNADGQLWNDYGMGILVHSSFAMADLQKLFHPYDPPRTPKYEFCIGPGDDAWWAANGVNFPHNRQTETRMPILVIERILPLPKPVREGLIDVFCPEEGRKGAKASRGNTNCIARLYLGQRRRSTKPPRFFKLKNFPLHLDQAEEIGLDIEAYATEMAIGLAICHWRANVDANDVEFVLGSAPTPANFVKEPTYDEIQELPPYTTTNPTSRYSNFRKRTTHLWMLDYDKCRRMTLDEAGIQQAAKAAEDNDPYMPRPHQVLKRDQDLWQHFRGSYLWASSMNMAAKRETSEETRGLPGRFLDAWEGYRREKVGRWNDG